MHDQNSLGNPASPKTSSFSVIEVASFKQLCHGNVASGQNYFEAIRHHSREMGLEFLKQTPSIARGSAAIVSIPRGGVPTATGLNQACDELGLPSAQHCSQIKTTPHALFRPEMFNGISTLIIADGVIGTGKTICNHLAQVPAEWTGRVAVFSNAASTLGLKTIREFAVDRMAQPVVGVAGHVFKDDECEWVDCGGKEVYFIGYNKRRGLDFRLPDFGDHISVEPLS